MRVGDPSVRNYGIKISGTSVIEAPQLLHSSAAFLMPSSAQQPFNIMPVDSNS